MPRINPRSSHQKPIHNFKRLYKEIKTKDGAKFSKFYLIPKSAHFNVIENPESCAAAVYNFINLENNNLKLKGENNVS